jgi:hypothetical protein
MRFLAVVGVVVSSAACFHPAPEPASCGAIVLATSTVVELAGSTARAAPARDTATCGDGATAPVQPYVWTVPVAGRYRVTATAAYPLVVAARAGVCVGPQLACVAPAANAGASFEIAVPAGREVTFDVTGRAGASGPFHLRLERVPDVCGDDLCSGDESCSTCARDCGACPAPPVCGDGRCDRPESCTSCPTDCGSCGGGAYCGDGVCDAAEDCDSCPGDCGDCQPEPYCGDGWCDAGEDCSWCPSDCGACGPTSYCGDGTCDADEDCSTCESDCGACDESYCGDGTCDADEDCSTCEEDCGACARAR